MSKEQHKRMCETLDLIREAKDELLNLSEEIKNVKEANEIDNAHTYLVNAIETLEQL